jgi:hypothetical protein
MSRTKSVQGRLARFNQVNSGTTVAEATANLQGRVFVKPLAPSTAAAHKRATALLSAYLWCYHKGQDGEEDAILARYMSYPPAAEMTQGKAASGVGRIGLTALAQICGSVTPNSSCRPLRG